MIGRAALLLTFLTAGVTADVYVTDKTFESTISQYRSMAATFGKPFPSDSGVSGRAVMVRPIDGCGKIDPPPVNTNKDNQEPDQVDVVELLEDLQLFAGGGERYQPGTSQRNHLKPLADSDPVDAGATTRWIAMIARYGGCNFEEKVRHATRANYSAVIVYNVGSNKLVPMAGSDDTLIPSVFIGGDDAQVLLAKYTYPKRPDLRIVVTDDHPFDINAYLLPFAIVVGICFVIVLIIVIYKCVQDYRRSRRHRLPKSALKKLPIHKFKQGDPFGTCCICLDDFEEGDKLRILPCDHGYHAKCIDPWLVKTKRICPQCRKRVFGSNERGAGLVSISSEDAPGSDSDSDYVRTGTSQASGGVAVAAGSAVAGSEREPLLPSTRRAPARYTQRERRNFRRSQRRSGGASQHVRAVSEGASRNQPIAASGHGPHGVPERGAEHPVGSTQRPLSTQERIRRAFVRHTSSPQPPIIQQQEIVSSEDYEETSDDGEAGRGHNDVTTTARIVTTNQEAVTVRIEQPSGSGSGSGHRSHHLVAEVHVVPHTQVQNNSNTHVNASSSSRGATASSEDQVSRGGDPREPRHLMQPESSDSSVVVMPASTSDSEGEQPSNSSQQRSSRKKSKRGNVENV